jgi:hypothetical protein
LYVVIWIFVNFTNKQKLCLWLGILLLQKSAKRNLNYEFLPVQCSRYNLQVPFQFPTFWPLLNRFCLAGKSIIGEFGLKELTKDEDLANATCKINVRSGHISSVLKTYAVSSSLRSFHSTRPPPPPSPFLLTENVTFHIARRKYGSKKQLEINHFSYLGGSALQSSTISAR